MTEYPQKKIAVVHDWLTGMRGGERVLETLCKNLRDVTIFCLFHNRGTASETIENLPIKTSFLSPLSRLGKKYRLFLPIFPYAVESLDLSEFDLVISLSHCVAHGARPREGANHFCYSFTPMRYSWDLHDFYLERAGCIERRIWRMITPGLQRWELAASRRVDRYFAISEHIADRIYRCYGRRAEVIYPPVDTDFFTPDREPRSGDYDLIVTALVPYKRVDTVIEAYNNMKKKLVVVGRGEEEAELKALAGPTIHFRRAVPPDKLRNLYRGCRFFVFNAVEDFGISPVEAQACGKPVVAYGEGGLLETVSEGETGLFFREQSAAALIECLKQAERMQWNSEAIRRRALRFGVNRFINEFRSRVIADDQYWLRTDLAGSESS